MHDLTTPLRKMTWETTLPLGVSRLDPEIITRRGQSLTKEFFDGGKVRCPVAGCTHFLSSRKRKASFDFCPEHHISVSLSPTYVYDCTHAQLNFIVGRDLLKSVEKAESGRLGNENSEDAVSWNVFVGLFALGGLREAFGVLTGIEAELEPELYVWGNLIRRDGATRWEQITMIQRQLESGKRQGTEPDIILRVPGKAIVLVEAKLRSPNSWLPEKRIPEYLKDYASRTLETDPLDRAWIGKQKEKAVFGQLLRNVIFSHWLAGEGEKQFVVNLVREGDASNIVELFQRHLRPEMVSFQRTTWERLAQLPILEKPEARQLRRYFQEKTVCLKKAFHLAD